MRLNFVPFCLLLLAIGESSRAQQNSAAPLLPPLLQRQLNTETVKEPDWTIVGYPQPVEFSYAKPALEAAQWWKGVRGDAKDELGTDALSKVQLAASLQAVQRFAQAHQDDAPLLVAWQAGGESWRVHLTPHEAASPRFPPSTQEWGVPKRWAEAEEVTFRLIPYGSPNGMTPQEANPLIIWSPANAMRWQMLYLSSRSAPTWYRSQKSVDAQFVRLDLAERFGGKSGVVYGVSNQEEASLVGNVLRSPGFFSQPILSYRAAMKIQGLLERGDEPPDLKSLNQRARERSYWVDWFNGPYHHLLLQSVTNPARFSRAEASLDVRYLTDNPSRVVPNWIEQGLQNLYGLDMADKIVDVEHPVAWLPPLPPSVVEMIWNRKNGDFYRETMSAHSSRRTLAATPIDEATPWIDNFLPGKPAISSDGPLLEDEDCTSQMRFFFERFGNGAVTETLQRLGSGQNIDTALRETIGLTQTQFFAAWQNGAGTGEK